ncbi:MAG: phosphatidylserine decarboxylase family protein [Planctomycetota bacterium]
MTIPMERQTASTSNLPQPEPLPDNIRSIQPGGGTVQALELAWGKWRRAWLKTIRPGYVREMRGKLKGDASTCPVEVVDSRDLKFFKNVSRCRFDSVDDPFAWRDRLPFARAGFAELLLFGGLFGGVALILASGIWVHAAWSIVPGALFAFVLYFFRDPERAIPSGEGSVVSPADGKIVDISTVSDPDFIGEPAVKIGIFLSVFNVHVNRCSLTGRLIRLRYHPGKFLNALYARSVDENERMDLYFVEPVQPHRRFIIKQIAGAIARRIVCEIAPGDEVPRGARFGMIKFGSRTELLLPAANLEVLVRVGDKVQGGATLLARYVSK